MRDNKYFNIEDTLWDITSKYPETIDVFVANGFEHIADEKKREMFAKKINLKTALMLKGFNIDSFVSMLVDAIENNFSDEDSTLGGKKNRSLDNVVRLLGVLPCPVRIPLLDELKRFEELLASEKNIAIDYELKAASVGVDWLKNDLHKASSSDDLPDIFISAGFDIFFDNNLIGKFKENFEDLTGFETLNESFADINLKDPKKHYSIISVVPAVFLVNTKELDGDIPRTWEDILSDRFLNSISLPVGDFDLFNSILVNIYKKFGDKGVEALSRNMLKSQHPSQMVKSFKNKGERPKVTIMPYFFTKTVKEGGPMVAVWPEDGSIISPIFMLTKKENKELIKPVAEFFSSQKVGKILSHIGLFPSVHPDVDNKLDRKNKFMWIGWDYIYDNSISDIIAKSINTFNNAVKAEVK